MSDRVLAFDAKLHGTYDNGGGGLCAVNTLQCNGSFIRKRL